MRTFQYSLLAVSLCLSPLVGRAQQFGDFRYSSNGTNITITGYTGIGGNVVIPAVIANLAVVSIGDSAFYSCTLTNVTIPESVTTIGNFAFSHCSLSSVTIPDSVNSIGEWAFSNCYELTSIHIPDNVTCIRHAAFSDCYGLSRVSIPNNVTSIGDMAFSSCAGLTSISIGNGVTSIGEGAFARCSALTSVTIPNSVTNIGVEAFKACFRLIEFSVESKNVSYSSLDGVLCDRNQRELIQFPGGRTGDYSIPNSITSIGPSAFGSCFRLTTLTIGNSVTTIGNHAFSSCSGLTSAAIPSSVMGIGDSAFSDCSSLTSVVIPNFATNIGNYAFYYCASVTNVLIGIRVTNIGAWAFSDCGKLGSIFFRGTPPAIGIGSLGSPTICYYLPGKDGWSATYGGRPAYLWNPAPQTTAPNFGVRSNRFGFNITGTADIPIVVEAITNVAFGSWVPQQTCTLTNGQIYFSDPNWGSYPTRAYRIRSP